MVLVVATQAQWANYGYGLGGNFYGGLGGYYPFGGAQLATTYAGPQKTTTYAGLPAAAGFPYYGYPSATASKYHAQDELGQVRFGYAHPGQAATNYQDAFGNQMGSYAYINPEGKEIRVSYTADRRGFRVLSNDLPVAPVANLVAPVQVQDTPEVAAAKAEFAAKFAAAKVATVPSRSKRQVLAYGAAPFAAYNYGINVSPFTYNLATPAVVATPAHPVREATLTRTILTPGHAVAYRVD